MSIEQLRRVVTPEQLADGYLVCPPVRRILDHPQVRLGEDIIRAERRDFKILFRLPDGNYVVQEPHAC